MQTASVFTLYYTPVPCHYAFAYFVCVCIHPLFIRALWLLLCIYIYIYVAPNTLYKDKKKSVILEMTPTRPNLFGCIGNDTTSARVKVISPTRPNSPPTRPIILADASKTSRRRVQSFPPTRLFHFGRLG